MATPITWRNVGNDTNHLAAAQILDMSRRTLSGALDNVGGVINKTEQINNNNIAALDEAAKQAYLDQVAGARSPEELAALQASGALDNARAQLSTAARAAVRGADEARAGALHTRDRNMVLEGRADQTYADGRVDRAYTVDRRAVTDGRADTRWNWDQGDRTYLETVTRPATEATNRRQATLGELTLTEAQRAAAEAERQRGLDRVVTDFSNTRQASLQGMREGVDSGLANFPGQLPRNSDGTLNLDGITTEQRTAANAHLRTQGLPTLDDLGNSDTAARANLTAALRQAGASPADLVRLDPTVTAGVSTVPVGKVGREAETAAFQQRINQAEEARVNDLYGTVTSQGNSAALMEAGKKVIGEVTNAMTGGRERYTSALSKFLGSGGIPVKYTDADGKERTERVLPSEAQLTRVLGQIKTGWFRNTESDVADLLKEWSTSAEAQEGAKEVLRIRDRNRILGINPPDKK